MQLHRKKFPLSIFGFKRGNLSNTDARQFSTWLLTSWGTSNRKPSSRSPHTVNHFPSASRSLLMNFYFSSQQVTSGWCLRRAKKSGKCSFRQLSNGNTQTWKTVEAKVLSIVARWVMLRRQKLRSVWDGFKALKFKEIKCNRWMKINSLHHEIRIQQALVPIAIIYLRL